MALSPSTAKAAFILLAAATTGTPAIAQQSPTDHMPQRGLYEELRGKKGNDENAEAPVKLPAAQPRAADLMAFGRSRDGELTYLLDRTSISMPGNSIVRYALVAQSQAGARNVSYESINCRTREIKVHAVGRGDGTWREPGGDWRTLRTQQHVLLANDFLCDVRGTRRPDDVLTRLRDPELATKRDYQ
jgi:hypothetical protein